MSSAGLADGPSGSHIEDKKLANDPSGSHKVSKEACKKAQAEAARCVISLRTAQAEASGISSPPGSPLCRIRESQAIKFIVLTLVHS